MNREEIKEDIFECKMYITDLETKQKSKEIDVEDLIFNDYIEFEFGNYDDEDYGTLPYKDFKFFINDYSVTFYSPQYKKLKQENEKLHHYKTLYQSLKKQKEELKDLLEEEKERLARECSQIYEDGLGRTRLVNEDIFNEVDKILSKLEELEMVTDEI